MYIIVIYSSIFNPFECVCVYRLSRIRIRIVTNVFRQEMIDDCQKNKRSEKDNE